MLQNSFYFLTPPNILTIIDLTMQNGEYVLAHIDLHWNSSEHDLSDYTSQTAVLEAQLHHYDLRFDSYEQARHVQGATLAVAMLFEV